MEPTEKELMLKELCLDSDEYWVENENENENGSMEIGIDYHYQSITADFVFRACELGAIQSIKHFDYDSSSTRCPWVTLTVNIKQSKFLHLFFKTL